MNKAFTIVELLIVIVVIGVLSLLTVVTFNGLQDRARDSAAHTTASQVQRKIELRNATYGSYVCSTCTTVPQVVSDYDIASLVTGGVVVYFLSDTMVGGFEFDKDKVAVLHDPTPDYYGRRYISIAHWSNKDQLWTTITYTDGLAPEIRKNASFPSVPGNTDD